MEKVKTVERLQEELEELKSTLVKTSAMLICFGLGVLVGWAIWGSPPI